MHLLSILISAILFGTVPLAQDDAPVGTYAAEFETVADNCKGQGIALSKTEVTVSQSGKQINVVIPEIPTLTGRAGSKGKLRAEARGESKVPGRSARYGLNARVENRSIQGVFVAEFFIDKKPHCTQSFSLTGTQSKR